jgi:hypothetical protein
LVGEGGVGGYDGEVDAEEVELGVEGGGAAGDVVHNCDGGALVGGDGGGDGDAFEGVAEGEERWDGVEGGAHVAGCSSRADVQSRVLKLVYVERKQDIDNRMEIRKEMRKARRKQKRMW